MKSSSIKRNYLFGTSNDHAPACEPRRGMRNWRRYYVLLGLAAIATFTLVLPGTALALVTSCPGGIVNVNIDGFPFCVGGPNNGQFLQSGGGGGSPNSSPVGSPGQKTLPPEARNHMGPVGGDSPLDNLLNLDDPKSGSKGNGSGQLGMYVSNGGTSGDVTLGGGGYSLRNGGVSISDTAGLIAPGTNSASYRENGGGGGLSGTYDASRFVGPNQHLWFNGAFDYVNSSTNFGGVGAGSTINSNDYSFTGTALYSNYNTYLELKGAYQFGTNSEFNSSDSSTGSYRSDGYEIDARVGHVFWLLNTMSQTPESRMAVKALPRTSDGYAIGLDLSGHLGYQSSVAKGFTDSAGFVFGDERVQGGETGLKAKLFATVQNNGLMWMPYVAGTVDWRFNYSHIANFPGQAALATGDAVTFDDATTFVGAKAGFDVRMTNGWIVGANGFYDHSSDTDIIGGKAYVKIPLGPEIVTARY
jgi:hypothetical protein